MFGLLLGSRSGAGREIRASIENPSVDLQDPDAWNELYGGGAMSDAGVMVSHRSATRLDAVWQAVTMIANDVGRMPLDVYIRGEDDSREVDTYHPAWYLVRRVANPYTAAFILWRRLVFHALLWGNGYLWIDRNGRGDPIGLYNLLPDRTAPEIYQGRLVYATETTKPKSGAPYLRGLEARNVFHLQGPGHDLWEGDDPCELARDTFGLGLAQKKFTSAFFRNGARTSGVLEIPLGTTPKSAEGLVEGFYKTQAGLDNAFKVVILRDGAKFHATSYSPKDAQNTDAEDSNARNVARRFNVAPSLLGIRDSQGYNSKTDDSQSYLDRTLSPWTTGITAEAHMKLLSVRQQTGDTHFFEHNANSLLQMNALQRYQVYAIGLRNKILKPNEARLKENMKPVDGGDEFLEAYGAGKKGASGDNQTNQHTGDNPAGTDSNANADGNANRTARMRLVFKITERARHKAKSSRAYLEWVEGGLKSFAPEAARCGISPADLAVFAQELHDIGDRAKSENELSRMVEAVATAFEKQIGDQHD